MEKRIALYGLLVVLASAAMLPGAMLSPEKLPRPKRTFARRPIANTVGSTGWRAPRCGTAWTATDEPSHTSASKHSSRQARSLEARWKVEGKAVSEIPVASSRPKRLAFDASFAALGRTLRFYVSVQDRHPFRNPKKDTELRHGLRRKL